MDSHMDEILVSLSPIIFSLVLLFKYFQTTFENGNSEPHFMFKSQTTRVE